MSDENVEIVRTLVDQFERWAFLSDQAEGLEAAAVN
jgi:hypothetical protein